jgi:hypothetical protein
MSEEDVVGFILKALIVLLLLGVAAYVVISLNGAYGAFGL